MKKVISIKLIKKVLERRIKTIKSQGSYCEDFSRGYNKALKDIIENRIK